MINTNCLKDMRCPKCGSLEPFTIQVLMLADVFDSGTEDIYGDVTWEEDSVITCKECGTTGEAKDFTVVEDSKKFDIDLWNIDPPAAACAVLVSPYTGLGWSTNPEYSNIKLFLATYPGLIALRKRYAPWNEVHAYIEEHTGVSVSKLGWHGIYIHYVVGPYHLVETNGAETVAIGSTS